MQERNVGKSGLRVSLVGLGCNNFGSVLDIGQTRRVVHEALDCGITLFDTADMYGNRGGSETQLGEILGPNRHEVVIATKFGFPMDASGRRRGASRRYILEAVEASLRRLRTDYLDLYFLHHPDPLTPMEETLRALDDVVRQGKVRYIGCSNLPAWRVVDAAWIARLEKLSGFVCCEDEYSLLAREAERDLVPAIEAMGLGLLPYFPLANSLLTGKYAGGKVPEGSRLARQDRFTDRYLNAANLEIADALGRFCAARGRSLVELAFCWLAAQRCVSSVIAGATRPEQIRQNVAATGWILSAEDLAEIDRLAPVRTLPPSGPPSM